MRVYPGLTVSTKEIGSRGKIPPKRHVTRNLIKKKKEKSVDEKLHHKCQATVINQYPYIQED